MLGTIYTISFLVGLGFAVVSAFFAGVADHSSHFDGPCDPSGDGGLHVDGSADVSALDQDIGHPVDAGVDQGHAHVHAEAGPAGAHAHPTSGPQLTMFSPMSLSVFATAFGGIGLAWRSVFGDTLAAFGFLTAIGLSYFIAAATFYTFVRLFKSIQGTSLIEVCDLVGSTGVLDVSVAGPEAGRIEYQAGGRRFVGTARSIDGRSIAKGSLVRILRVDKNIFYVESCSEDDPSLLA